MLMCACNAMSLSMNLKVDVILDLLYKMVHLTDDQLTLQQCSVQFCTTHRHSQSSLWHSYTDTDTHSYPIQLLFFILNFTSQLNTIESRHKGSRRH